MRFGAMLHHSDILAITDQVMDWYQLETKPVSETMLMCCEWSPREYFQIRFQLTHWSLGGEYNYMNPGYFTLAAIDLKP